MRKTQKFYPAVSVLECRQLQSVAGHRVKPISHGPAYVVHPVRAAVHQNAVNQPPHQIQQARHTGTLISAELTASRYTDGDIVGLSGSGITRVDRVPYSSGVSITTTGDGRGLMVIVTQRGFIQGEVVERDYVGMRAGNYTITRATGDFSGMAGTGYYEIHAAGGKISIAFNPHQ